MIIFDLIVLAKKIVKSNLPLREIDKNGKVKFIVNQYK